MTEARCDICGEPHLEDQGVYTIMSEYDEAGNLTSFRHWDCQEKQKAKLKEDLDKVKVLSHQAQAALSGLSRRFRGY